MTEPRKTADALVLLANLGRPRRPAGAATASAEPVLPSPAAASVQLAGLVDRVHPADLADLRRLQQAAVRAAEAIHAGDVPDVAEINVLSAGSTAHVEILVTDGVPRRRLVWTDTSSASALARRIVDELSALDPDRLRRCARPECDLLFYDTSKSGTRRWHAEKPCGWRERQRLHRRRQPS